ncbi:hypothetical protein D3C73_573980 [compost metagenome]
MLILLAGVTPIVFFSVITSFLLSLVLKSASVPNDWPSILIPAESKLLKSTSVLNVITIWSSASTAGVPPLLTALILDTTGATATPKVPPIALFTTGVISSTLVVSLIPFNVAILTLSEN